MSPRARQHRRVRRSTSPLGRVEPTRAEAILLNDTSITRIEASSIARASQGEPSREAKVAHHFVQQNAQTLAQFGIEARVDFDGHRVYLDFYSGPQIGAFPLVSPVSGKAEVTLIVRPRFGWAGLGRSLGISGFKIIPRILPLPLLPRTEQEIPDWILSTTILPRLKEMLSQLSRRFEIVENIRTAPRGYIDWGRYVSEKLPSMKFLERPVPLPGSPQ